VKISFLVPEIVRSGGMRVIFEYANRLKLKGHEVVLFTPIVPFNPFKGKSNINFQKYRIKTGIKYFTEKSLIPGNIFPYGFRIKYIPFVNNFYIPDADALIATSWTTAYYADKLNSSKGKKSYLIQGFEIWNCNEDLARESYRLDLNRIVVSKYLKDLLSELFSTDSTEIMPGINYDTFYNPDKIFNDQPVISFADHQLEIKNIKGAITTVIKLKEKYPDLKFKVFGVSRYNDFPDFVTFTKCIDDEEIRKMYCSSDIFLFPSLNEGFGLPPAEAMACNCAVVGNSVAAFPEFSVHNRNAVQCDPGNENGLFEGVCGLIEDREKLKRISMAASTDIRKILNWNDSVNKFEEEILN